jgi:hypothetical protein
MKKFRRALGRGPAEAATEPETKAQVDLAQPIGSSGRVGSWEH